MGGKWSGYRCNTKFWRIRRVGLSQETWHGAVGTKGKVSVKHFESEEAVAASIKKIVASKLRKAYVVDKDAGEPGTISLQRGRARAKVLSRTQPDKRSLRDGRARATKSMNPRYFGAVKVSNAIADGNAKRLRKLLVEGVKPDVRGVHDGFREFNHAVHQGEVECVRVFIDAGVTIDSLEGDQPPIASALWADANQVEVLQLLLDNGADPNGLCPDGRPDEVREAFVGDGEPALHCALRCPGETKLVSIGKLVDAGLDTSAVDCGGSTLLHVAAREAQLHIVALLIELGVPINHRDDDGKTAFEICRDVHMVSPLSSYVAWDQVMALIAAAGGQA